MAENARAALEELLTELRGAGVADLADEISSVIARGATRETQGPKRSKELAQAPLQPDEALSIALDMFIASFDPVLMKTKALQVLTEGTEVQADIHWNPDFIENSPISPPASGNAELPEIPAEDIQRLETDLKSLLALREKI